MSVAFVFPGQGSQRVGMGRALAEDELQLTTNTQPALLAASIAALRALEAEGLRPDWVAGHSLGEYSALVASGVMSLSDALRTVRLRGRFMQEAVPVGVGAMAAILGLDLAEVQKACREAARDETVSPANINSPGQVVIAGHATAVDRALDLCRAAGAKRAVRLSVSAPFHCALMRPAQDRLAQHLAGISFVEPRVPLVNNVDARVVRDAAACRDGLVRQVAAPVRWEESVRVLIAEGVETFVEVGPGGVLAGLIKRISKGARVLPVEDPGTLAEAKGALCARAGSC
jgi:[acyl-carrier-protein] S-malonyltransferase